MNFESHQTGDEAEINQAKHRNPVIQFFSHVGEACQYYWEHYVDWLMFVSWPKVLLAGLLSLILAGFLHIYSLVSFLVLGSLLAKCFIGKEDLSATKQNEDVLNEEVKS